MAKEPIYYKLTTAHTEMVFAAVDDLWCVVHYGARANNADDFVLLESMRKASPHAHCNALKPHGHCMRRSSQMWTARRRAT